MTYDDRSQKRIADLERHVRSRPEDGELFLQLIRSYLDAGRHAQAIGRLESRMAEDETSYELVELSCEAYRRGGEFEKALEVLEREGANWQGEASYWTLRGRILEGFDELEDAERAHERAVQIDPDRAESHFRLGVVRMRMGENNDALDSFEEAVAIDPEMINAQINIGILLDEMGSPHEAVAAFKAALNIDARSLETRLNLGASYGDLGMPKEAITEFRAALGIDPMSVLGHFNLGVALLEESPEEAQVALKRALTLEPGHWEANYHLAVLYFKRGMYDAAIRSFHQCLESKPRSVRALYHLGLAYNKKDQPGRAIEFLSRVTELEPENSRAHFYLGVAHDKKGQYDKARLCYQAADRLGARG